MDLQLIFSQVQNLLIGFSLPYMVEFNSSVETDSFFIPVNEYTNVQISVGGQVVNEAPFRVSVKERRVLNSKEEVYVKLNLKIETVDDLSIALQAIELIMNDFEFKFSMTGTPYDVNEISRDVLPF